MPISAHNAVVTCSVFAPNPNRILDQILRNTTGLRSEEAELEEVDAEDTRSEPAVDKAGARSKHSKAKQPQHHVRVINLNGQSVISNSYESYDHSQTMPSFANRVQFQGGYVIVSGDYDGEIKVFYLFSKPKHSSLPESAATTAATTPSSATN